MPIRELTVLLPCHGLEDFPVYHEDSAADELLAAWCILWHPALITAAGRLPDWQRIDIPPEDLAGRLITVPPFCLDRLPAGFATRVENEGGRIVAESKRQATLERLLEQLDGEPGGDAILAADFQALGFCRLQIELLTRQMRYLVNIDETHFQNETLAAARAAVAGDETAARNHLGQCFDTLYEARKHFYPVDVYLLDITLLAETTLGPALDAELARGTPLNLMATSSVLGQLAAEHPTTWSTLLKAADHEKVCVLGGERQERELPLLPIEMALASLVEGNKQYEALLGRNPNVYARRRAGLWPALPQLLAKLAYYGALHFTLDDGRFPLAPQCKVRWEGLETSVVDIFGRVPSDAAKPDPFLGLSRLIADAMDTDHVATVAFAHWPGRTSPWYDDLRRIADWSPVLGKFMLLDDYFMHTDMPGRLSKFEADDYRTPYLKQAIIRRESDALSTFVRAHQQQAERTALAGLSTICRLIAPRGEHASDNVTAALDDLAGLVSQGDGPPAQRALVFNPSIYGRRINVELAGFASAPAVAGPVLAAGAAGDRKFAVVEVPSMGFVWIEPSATADSGSNNPPIAAENVLRNEFMEVKISSKTGGIQSLYNFNQRAFGQRGNQLSQQIAYRMTAGREPAYSTMQAESVEITAATPAYGEFTSRGTLITAEGSAVGRFQQTTRLWAGSRLVHVDIELLEIEEPRADPWNAYYAVRLAWPDEHAQLWRGVSSARQRTEAARIEAPEFVDVDNGVSTISLLTGGLPYHRRSDPRMLDTLLVVRGETARRFTLAIGVDVAHPAAAAMELFAPRLVHVDAIPLPRNTSGWFFHVGAKHIVATHWEPIFDEPGEGQDLADASADNVKGFRTRLLDVSGQAGRVPLRAFRPVSYARQVDFLGETILELYVDDDKIMLDFGPHELLEVEVLWIR